MAAGYGSYEPSGVSGVDCSFTGVFLRFFIGVNTRMLKVDPLWGTSYGGSLFEQFLVVEWFKRAQYERNDYRFSYLQTKSGLEIDLVIERPGKPLAFIQIKSTDTVTERDFSTLRRLLPDFPEAEGFLVSRDRIEQVSDRIRALPWERALEEI
jgi:predicted AAA+ superfamily ATPase